MAQFNACEYCGEPVDPDSLETYHRVQGWEKYRAGGGTNAIARRKVLPGFMHGHCMKMLNDGVSPSQGQMFSV